VVVAAEEPLWGDAWVTAASSPKPEGSDWMVGHGSCVGKPLKTRPPGYSLPPLPFFLDSLANIDWAVWGYSQRQMTIESEQPAYERRRLKQRLAAHARDNIPVRRDDGAAEGYLSTKATIIGTMRIGLMSATMPILEMLRDGWQSIFDYGDRQEVLWKSTISNILTLDGTLQNEQLSAEMQKNHLPAALLYRVQSHLLFKRPNQVPNTMPVTMQITIPNTMPYVFGSDITKNNRK